MRDDGGVIVNTLDMRALLSCIQNADPNLDPDA